MIAQLSKKIASFFIDNKIIEEEEKDVYIYSLEFFLAILRDAITVLIIGGITRMLLETVFFLVALIPMRQKIGGYHASSHLKCFITFQSVYLIYLMIIKFTPVSMLIILSFIILVISAIIVILLAPVEHENKPLNKFEKLKLRNQSRWILGIDIIVILGGTIFFRNNVLLFSISLGLLTAALSCMIAWLQKINKEVKENRKC